MPRGRPIVYQTLSCHKCLKTKDRSEFPTPTSCRDCYKPRKPPVDSKQCSECLEVRPLSEYHRKTDSRCKGCIAPRLLEAQRLHKYGISDAVFDELWEIQSGSCGICKVAFGSKSDACVDHKHTTSAVRGLLCSNCNKAIGFLRDSPMMCISASAWCMREGTLYDERKRRLTRAEKEYICDNPDKKSTKKLMEQFGKSEQMIGNIRFEIRNQRKLIAQSQSESPRSEASLS